MWNESIFQLIGDCYAHCWMPACHNQWTHFIWFLPFRLFDMGGTTKRHRSSQHSLQGHWNTQVTRPYQGSDERAFWEIRALYPCFFCSNYFLYKGLLISKTRKKLSNLILDGISFYFKIRKIGSFFRNKY